jgi:predicted transcriptional regulator
MKYRSRADITSEVLQTMSNGNISLTRIMYGSFTSYIQAKEYTTYLEKRGLITHDLTSASYGLTEEGIRVLGKLREISAFLNIEPRRNSDTTGYFSAATHATRSHKAVDKGELDSRPVVEVHA